MPSSILNSDDGVISGTSGLKNSGGDDAVLLIQTKGVTAATVSASQVFDFVNPPTGIPTATIASTAEAQAGTDNTVFITPLRMREGFNASGSAPVFACRAFVNFDGTTNVGGNCTIRASGNVSTVADNGTGNYTVNLTTAMPDADYAMVGGVKRVTFGDSNMVLVFGNAAEVPTTTTFKIRVGQSTDAAARDSDIICASIFR